MSISSIVSGLGSKAAKTFNSRPMAIAAKGLGFVSLCTTLYDAHVNGANKAISTDRIDTADRYERQYKNYAAMSGKSQTIATIKNYWYECQKNFPFYHLFSKTCGYVSGFSKTLLFDLPLIGISSAALMTKKFPKIGKTAGILLALNAAKTLLYDVIGIGKNKK